ncbi:hypothetical protein KY343_04655 [Candidatus Woesearchaeota archaeon]|nr:hypothetical protein [Candidatus Woesearchaeota archaeon]
MISKIKSKVKKVGKVVSYVDLISQITANYLGQKYVKRVEEIKESVLDALYGFKAQVFRSTIEIFLLITGLAALIVGIILFLMNYVSLDKILIAYGLIVSFGILFTAKLRR